MIINGVSVKGLFKFIKGLHYEKDDLIYFDGDIYYVNASYVATVDPIDSPYCELYIVKYHELVDVVTGKDILSELAKLIDGIRAGGYLGSIEATGLDQIKKTAVYQIHVNNTSIAPYEFNGIFRSYKLDGNVIIQEILDYGTDSRSPNLFFRRFSNGWSSWVPIVTVNGSADLSTFGTYLRTIAFEIGKATDNIEEYAQLVKTAPFRILEPSSDGYLVGQVECVLNIIAAYTEGGVTCQECFTMDPTALASSNTAIGSSGRRIVATRSGSGSTMKVRLTPSSGLTILKVIQINR